MTDRAWWTTRTGSTWSATARRVPGSSTRSPRRRTSSRSGCSEPTTAAPGPAFAAAIEWAIDQGFGVVNLSLSSRSEAMAERFHELADAAYFANTLLVSAANNVVGASYPSLFAAVVSVAAHDAGDPDAWFYNPTPPVEFGAHGLDVDVAWRGGTRIRATGNSFAAPHIAGRAALIRARYPDASPFEVKAMLAATASDPGIASIPRT